MPAWDMKGWKKGPVTLFEAFGLKKGTISFPPFNPKLPDQVNAAAQKSSTENASGSAPSGLPTTGGGNKAANIAIGRTMAAKFGWTGSQFDALISLWDSESGWNQNAYNQGSGATGIPQSLPGSKMASAGADWRTNPVTQMKWGMMYIRQVYGTPQNAYNQWLGRSPHWY